MRLPRPDHLLLLDAALLPGPGAVAAWQGWRAVADLDRVDAGSYRLLPMVADNLGDRLDGEIAGRISGIARHAWVRTQRLLAGGEPVVAALAAAGIPSLLLKGAALVVGYEIPARHRPMNDLDLAVPHDAFDDALRVCAEHGLDARGTEPAHAFWQRSHAVPLAGPGSVSLDLHRATFASWPGPAGDRGLWRDAIPTSLRTAPCLVPNPAGLLVAVIEHAQRWNPEDSNVRWVADAVALLRVAKPDWDEVTALARQVELTATTAEALRWLRARYEVDVPDDALAVPRRRPVATAVERAWATPEPARGPAARAAVALTTETRRLRPPGRRARPAELLEAARRAVGVERARHLPAEVAFVALGRPAALRPWRPTAGAEGRAHVAARTPTTVGEPGTAGLGRGWSVPQANGTWTDDGEADLHLEIDDDLVGTDVLVELELAPLLGPGFEVLDLDVQIGRRRPHRRRFAGSHVEFRTVAVRVVPTSAQLDLTLVVHPPRRPLDLGLSNDVRRLGVLLRSVGVRPLVGTGG